MELLLANSEPRMVPAHREIRVHSWEPNMSKVAEIGLQVLSVDRTLQSPLHLQIYNSIRRYILENRLPADAKLPATRDLAKQLGVGRNTIIAAYDQLLVEGFVETRPGSSTRVARLMRQPRSAGRERPSGAPSLSRRGALIAGLPQPPRTPGILSLFPGVPETVTFPYSTWARLLARNARKHDDDIVGIHDFAGHRRLRAAIADYLGTARGIDCAPEQVIVVTGAQAALDLAVRVLTDEGDWAWMEEPGYRGARSALLGYGLRLAPLRVARGGWQLSDPELPAPRVVYVTPSCQWPLGIVMRMEERQQLLALAAKRNFWVIEDDYDGEYRFRGRPAPALRGLDGADRVVYVGTFGKTLFPSLRLGFLVVPLELAKAFGCAVSVTGQFAPQLLQVAVADFMRDGYFAAHLKRMRRLYAKRQAKFVEICRELIGAWATVEENDSGMQVLARLAAGLDDQLVCETARSCGVDVQPVSIDYHCDSPESGLLLGFAALDTATAERGLLALRTAFLKIEKGKRSS